MTTLVDTSVWIDHLRRGNNRLVDLLEDGVVVCHPFIVGELACGMLRNRDQILTLLNALPTAPIADHEEVLTFVDERKLAGRGLGWIDVHLLASVLLADYALWTLDKALGATAAELRIVSG